VARGHRVPPPVGYDRLSAYHPYSLLFKIVLLQHASPGTGPAHFPACMFLLLLLLSPHYPVAAAIGVLC
jgi:hypothetical protein